MADSLADSERDVDRVRASGRRSVRDVVAVEAPLELRVGGSSLIMVMRTPGHDQDLARGLLYSEGVIDGAAELSSMHRPATRHPGETGNVLELGLDRAQVDARMPSRSLYASSACGVCGKTSIASLELRAQPIRVDPFFESALISALPGRLGEAQQGFERTGGVHAAALFDAEGGLLAIREDVGRHNAVDKVVGWALAAGRLPLGDAILCVSGRLSFEIVQKAVVAGVPLVVAVSAPSSLAVDLAERFRVTLCGFTRGGGFNIYSHAARIA